LKKGFTAVVAVKTIQVAGKVGALRALITISELC
jgi:hypothetical protein